MVVHFDTAYFLAWVVAFTFGMALHYYAQAFVAYRLGDMTPRVQGRVKLNPSVHHEPFGLLMAFLLSVSPTFSGVAWGKPVPRNTFAVKGGRLTNLLIVLAGPLSNLLVALVLSLIFKSYINQSIRTDFLAQFVFYLILVNIFLFAFNLYIPLAPLDGLSVWRNVLPSQWSVTLQPLETYGPYILLVLIFVIPFFLRIPLLSYIINPLVVAVLNLFGLPVPVWL